MVAILMTPAKLFTLGLLSSKVFQNKVHDVIISVKTSPTKFYHVIQFVLQMWSCDQIMVEIPIF